MHAKALALLSAAFVIGLSGCSMVNFVEYLSELPPESTSETDHQANNSSENNQQANLPVPLAYSTKMSAEEAAIVFENTLVSDGAGAGPIDVEKMLQTLIGVGFPEDSLESTAERSQVQLPVDSVSVSLALNGECIIGQVAKTWVVVEIEPAFDDGTCLIKG